MPGCRAAAVGSGGAWGPCGGVLGRVPQKAGVSKSSGRSQGGRNGRGWGGTCLHLSPQSLGLDQLACLPGGTSQGTGWFGLHAQLRPPAPPPRLSRDVRLWWYRVYPLLHQHDGEPVRFIHLVRPAGLIRYTFSQEPSQPQIRPGLLICLQGSPAHPSAFSLISTFSLPLGCGSRRRDHAV